GAQLDRMRPVGGVAGHGGRERGDVEYLRRPRRRPGLQQEQPARPGRGEPPGQRAAGRPAADDHDVVLLTHGSSMAARTDDNGAVAPLADLTSFLTASPTPYHAVAQAV